MTGLLRRGEMMIQVDQKNKAITLPDDQKNKAILLPIYGSMVRQQTLKILILPPKGPCLDLLDPWTRQPPP